MKPYPSEHACRLNDPGKYDSMRRNNCAEKHDGKCIDVIYGIKDGKSEIQALRYSKDVWDAAAARAHCGSRGGSFEAASGKDAEGEVEESKATEGTERKIVSLKQMKFEEDGTFKALFAPFNNVDKQGDLTLPGAFGRQNVIISSYDHGSWTGALPVGKGVIYDGEDGGIVEGKFFLDTTGGKDTYNTVKQLGDLQEWSYALPEIESETMTINEQTVRVLKRIRVNEVSPVLMGAGNGTRTLAIKSGASFVEDVERMMISAENVIDRLKGRVDNRLAVLRNPSATDLKRAREMKDRFEEMARNLGELIEQNDAYTAALSRFETITQGETKDGSH